MTSAPTPAQIAQVQSNLQNMQALNDFIYNQGGQSRIFNAYLLLSEQDDSDPGLAIVLDILEGVFWAIGSEFGPVGNFVASFLSGMVSSWATSTPPNLNTTFASLDIRLQNTSITVDTQLATYHQDVTANWNVQFTYNGQTQTLSSLANIVVPPETDPQFFTLANAAIFALDQQVWKSVMLDRYGITHWLSTQSPTSNLLPGSQDQPPIDWVKNAIAAHPSYDYTWTWYSDPDYEGWEIRESNIGTGGSVVSDGAMSSAACHYLFIDSADGVVTNPIGLYTRATVFNSLGIPQVSRPLWDGARSPE